MKKPSKVIESVQFLFNNPVSFRSPLVALLCALTTAWCLPQAGKAQGCVDQGVELGEGLLYLQGHARPDTSRAIATVTSDPFANRLILINDDDTRTTIQIAGVDCTKTAFGTGWQGENRMWIYCKDGSKCVQDETKVGDVEDWEPQGAARNSATYITEAGDTATTEELSRTFSHVLFVLQQRFAALNADDPVPAQP